MPMRIGMATSERGAVLRLGVDRGVEEAVGGDVVEVE